MAEDKADQGWDDYAERVLRNEGRLGGLETLVAETRESDRKLIEQRSESLARELERRAEALIELVNSRSEAVRALSKEERDADKREVDILCRSLRKEVNHVVESFRREGEITLNLLREVYDTAIADLKRTTREQLDQNLSQSQAAIHELELRRQAATEKVEQMVRQWRESDREAREIFAHETQRHLEQLNHNNERISHVLASSVTRELWQSEKDATMTREAVIRDQLIALDRQMLTMTPLAASERAHADMNLRMERAVAAASEVLDNKIAVVSEKVSELRSYRDTSSGRATGYSQFYGWAVAGFGLLASIVITANALLR